MEDRFDCGDGPVDCGFHDKVAEASLLLELLAHELHAVERCACRIFVGFAGLAGFVEDSLCELHIPVGHEGKDTGDDQAYDGGERLNCCGPRGDGLGPQKNLHYFRFNRAWNANFGADMARRFSNALLDGRRPVKDHRISFEKTLARF